MGRWFQHGDEIATAQAPRNDNNLNLNSSASEAKALFKVLFQPLMVSLFNHPSFAMSILRQAQDERDKATNFIRSW